MQAIMETLFDVIYLISVITIGILMIRGSRGNSQYRLFGFMAVVLGAGDAFHLIPRAVALCTTGLEHYTISLGLGKWITSVTMTIFYVLLYICVAAAIQGQGTERADRCGLSFGRPADHPVYDAAEPVAQCRCALFLGHLSQYTLCAAGPCGHRIVLSQRQGAWRPGFRWMWLTIVLSFGFYIPVALWADAVPMIGMLMIPKTCAYVWTVLIGYFAMKQECR